MRSIGIIVILFGIVAGRPVSLSFARGQEPFASGECGMHVTQFQKPDPSKDDFKLDIQLFDAAQTLIGASGTQEAPANVGIDVFSSLPNVMIVIAQNADPDPIKFSIGEQTFDSNAAQCSVGRYDSGKRQMDCRFTC
ncbi:hypothetical protein DL96DRAFT_766580 [Flagelloscypha sp. PMI_526]|nr:hypothetical protein DL96DRAFT_766580 [Flagelloscypha sp. PMI_526]